MIKMINIKHLSTLLMSVMLLFIVACEKNNAGILDDSFKPIEDWSRSNVSITPDSATRVRLFNEFEAERTSVFNELDRLDAVKLKAFKKDLESYDTITTTQGRIAFHSYIESTYKSWVAEAWNNLGFDKAALTNRAKNILGSIPFEMGEFGQISSVAPVNSGSTTQTPQETTHNLGIPFLISNSSGSGVLNGRGSGSNNTSKIRLVMNADLLGGGIVEGKLGNSITLDNNYRYFRIQAALKKSHISCFASALGGSGSESKLDLVCMPSDPGLTSGVIRNIGSVWCVAPIIWQMSSEKILDQSTMTIGGQTSQFGGGIQVYFKLYTGAGVAGAGHANALGEIQTVDYLTLTQFN
ncbi:MAG: hypothetical protein JNL57_13500 [Bacteroidetes bacterium]|nr:hypothetical protein [Bacteroidota bacterium]